MPRTTSTQRMRELRLRRKHGPLYLRTDGAEQKIPELGVAKAN